ncbi:MAG: hypothetical protein GPI90_10365 [Microcystis aeruginosa K13-05]|nr:hypothetical protein [Microcystis aeruginosa K13-05]
MLDKTFGLFSPQKVPAIAGIGGKIPGLFPKSIKPHTPHPTPHTLPPPKSFLPQTLSSG